eukprot:Phypoly_transcript_08427.p1 GENE.Phypoly_transcript_08427~~Phypoly_transcript_08427.p1  ORF type:complete len:445 (+),score=35.78 Phypoly_transcript_08427:160-1494(+)
MKMNLTLLGLVTACVVIAYLFDSISPHMYMDEIFHIPQTQAYCTGHFKDWNPKITTLPGLYIVATVYGWVIHFISSGSLCSPVVLRSLNVLFGLATFIILEKILQHTHPNHLGSARIRALSLCMLPVLFFFNFLYYTDAGSVFFVLLSYDLSLAKRHWFSALAGLVSVIFRQTNIVWIGFVAVTSMLHFYDLSLRRGKREPSFLGFGYFCWKYIRHILRIHLPYILVACAFVVFLIANGGNITVGDHDNHTFSLNFVQPLYFILFSLFFAFPTILYSPARPIAFLNKVFQVRTITFVAILTALFFAIVHHSTFVHPFILADNRHYTFYIWKNIFRRYYWSKYALIPFYCYGFWAFKTILETKKQLLWGIFFTLATCAVILPTPLVEFRYYITPFIFLIVHLPVPPAPAIILQLLLNVSINIITIYGYLCKPFTAPDGSVGRFMW